MFVYFPHTNYGIYQQGGGDFLTRWLVLGIQKAMKYGMGETKKCAGSKPENTAMKRIAFINLSALQIYG